MRSLSPLVGALIAAAGMASLPGAQSPGGVLPEPAQTLLARDLGFTQGQQVLLRNGRPLARTMATERPKEIAVAGAVRVGITKEQFVAQYRDIVRFKRHKAVLQIGRFSSPPMAEDLAPLTMDDGFLAALRRCQPGQCKVKLPDDWMADFRTIAATAPPDWNARALALYRQRLADYVAAYQSRGASALMRYADKQPPVSVADEARLILDRSAALRTVAPDLYRYIAEYPAFVLPMIDSFFYWSKEDLGVKPILSLTQVSIHQPAAFTNTVVVAARQIYAAHYSEGSLGLTVAIDAGTGERDGIYLIYVNRTIVDALKGAFGGIRRSIVRGKAEDGLLDELGAMKRRLEAGAQSDPD